ncbi:MAG: hypothetical protein OCD02_20515 [Spirochaetaceae bacterium]
MKLKSLFNTILLLTIFAFIGFIFWLGWEQLQLEESTYGVVFTKTTGWNDNIIESGKFNWSIEKVIPKNYTIHKFQIKYRSINFNINNKLPSGDLYADFNKISKENFNYNYSVVGSINFNTSELTSQLNSGIFTENTFIEWENNTILEIKEALKVYMRNNLFNEELSSSAIKYISSIYPYYTFTNIYINLERPDIDLYESCRDRYLKHLNQKALAEENYLAEILKQKNEESLKLELLKQYGEVFTQYPIMIEYIKIDKEMVFDRATIEDLLPIPNQK